ncbi:hypothetical protein ABT155_40875, partial [Streptomyces hirsutus]
MLEHELLDLTEAERESVVQPHAVGDHLDRVPRCPLYDGDVPSTDDPSQHDQPEEHPTRSTNVT